MIRTIRGLTFEEYLKLVWEEEDGELHTIALLAMDKAGISQWEMKALPDATQVYWFERAKNDLVKALRNISK